MCDAYSAYLHNLKQQNKLAVQLYQCKSLLKHLKNLKETYQRYKSKQMSSVGENMGKGYIGDPHSLWDNLSVVSDTNIRHDAVSGKGKLLQLIAKTGLLADQIIRDPDKLLNRRINHVLMQQSNELAVILQPPECPLVKSLTVGERDTLQADIAKVGVKVKLVFDLCELVNDGVDIFYVPGKDKVTEISLGLEDFQGAMQKMLHSRFVAVHLFEHLGVPLDGMSTETCVALSTTSRALKSAADVLVKEVSQLLSFNFEQHQQKDTAGKVSVLLKKWLDEAKSDSVKFQNQEFDFHFSDTVKALTRFFSTAHFPDLEKSITVPKEKSDEGRGEGRHDEAGGGHVLQAKIDALQNELLGLMRAKEEDVSKDEVGEKFAPPPSPDGVDHLILQGLGGNDDPHGEFGVGEDLVDEPLVVMDSEENENLPSWVVNDKKVNEAPSPQNNFCGLNDDELEARYVSDIRSLELGTVRFGTYDRVLIDKELVTDVTALELVAYAGACEQDGRRAAKSMNKLDDAATILSLANTAVTAAEKGRAIFDSEKLKLVARGISDVDYSVLTSARENLSNLLIMLTSGRAAYASIVSGKGVGIKQTLPPLNISRTIYYTLTLKEWILKAQNCLRNLSMEVDKMNFLLSKLKGDLAQVVIARVGGSKRVGFVFEILGSFQLDPQGILLAVQNYLVSLASSRGDGSDKVSDKKLVDFTLRVLNYEISLKTELMQKSTFKFLITAALSPALTLRLHDLGLGNCSFWKLVFFLKSEQIRQEKIESRKVVRNPADPTLESKPISSKTQKTKEKNKKGGDGVQVRSAKLLQFEAKDKPKNKSPCNLCGQSHFTWDCKAFPIKGGVGKAKAFCREKKLCHGCLSKFDKTHPSDCRKGLRCVDHNINSALCCGRDKGRFLGKVSTASTASHKKKQQKGKKGGGGGGGGQGTRGVWGPEPSDVTQPQPWGSTASTCSNSKLRWHGG